jgi:hypothetical protein
MRAEWCLKGNGDEYPFTFTNAGYFDKWPRPEAIRPAPKL